ncbi:glycosyltransferase [Nocardioides rotundus]|uniref:glycosyltransferase family 2 protein n=1 Tax=Nocardioides rotundus TaxID=1774216 RepID=UPI001CC05DA4|nr:glycosyltransferase family 2 protein [Nocardioides rotundus]UAL30585.1 glycosyltransferase [Nocardioides rotundus]
MGETDVDVVIATKDRPELLRLALDAVRRQDHDGVVRTFVVFDQSEPDFSIASDDPRRPVRVITNSRKPGLAGARNSGVEAGDAPFVAFCDDDDEWLPAKVSRQLSAFRAHPEALTSVTGIFVLYRGREMPRVPDPADLRLDRLVRDRVMEAHPSTVMVRRTALDGPIGWVNEDVPGSHGEDYDWILRAARAGQFAVVGEPLVKVVWGQSMFSTKWPTIIAATDYLLEQHPEFQRDRKALARMYGQRAFALAASGRRREAFSQVWKTARANPTEKRIPVALTVAMGLVRGEQVMDLAHRTGRGI